MESPKKRKRADEGEGTGEGVTDPVEQAAALLSSSSVESTELLAATRQILEKLLGFHHELDESYHKMNREHEEKVRNLIKTNQDLVASLEKLTKQKKKVSQYVSVLERVC
jgi:flagellar motility protein MotE (MotC chaperone)